MGLRRFLGCVESALLTTICVLMLPGTGCDQKKAIAALPRHFTVENTQSKVAESTLSSQSGTSTLASVSPLPVYELKMTAKDLAALEQSAYENETHPASFIANGV